MVVPLRGAGESGPTADEVMTTTQVRKLDFEIVVPLGADGTAEGELYLDDGVSLEQKDGATTEARFRFADGVLTVDGEFGYDTPVRIAKVTFLGLCPQDQGRGAAAKVKAAEAETGVQTKVDEDKKIVTVAVDLPLTGGFTVELV